MGGRYRRLQSDDHFGRFSHLDAQAVHLIAGNSLKPGGHDAAASDLAAERGSVGRRRACDDLITAAVVSRRCRAVECEEGACNQAPPVIIAARGRVRTEVAPTRRVGVAPKGPCILAFRCRVRPVSDFARRSPTLHWSRSATLWGPRARARVRAIESGGRSRAGRSRVRAIRTVGVRRGRGVGDRREDEHGEGGEPAQEVVAPAGAGLRRDERVDCGVRRDDHDRDREQKHVDANC